MMSIRSLVIAGVMSLAASAAVAAPKPNCEVGKKKEHVADKKACDAKKGKWLEEAAATTTTATPAPAPAPAPAAPKK